MKLLSYSKAMSKSTIFGNFMLQFVVLCLRMHSGKARQSRKILLEFSNRTGLYIYKKNGNFEISADEI